MQHILVPTDFSETAHKALLHALPLAELTGARITLLHVIFHEKLKEVLWSGIGRLPRGGEHAQIPTHCVRR